MVSVLDFGAKGNGVDDDTIAVQDAFDSIASQGAVHFPAGTYKLSGTLTIRYKSIALYGEGKAVTHLKWITATDGIRYFGGGQDGIELNRFSIADLTLLTAVPDAGIALDMAWGDMPFNYLPKCCIRDIEIRGWQQLQNWEDTPHWWQTGIRFKNPGGTAITNLEILGNPKGSLRGIRLECTESNGVYRHFLSHVHIRHFDIGMDWGGHIEGVYLTNFEIVGCRIGFQSLPFRTNSGGPVWHVSNGHMDNRQMCVNLSAQNEVKLNNVAFFHTGNVTPRECGNIVQMNQCARVTVSGCSFFGFAGDGTMTNIEDQNGVWLAGCDSGLVVGNHFDAIKDIAIVFWEGSQRCHSIGNRVHACGQRFRNDGSHLNTDDNLGS